MSSSSNDKTYATLADQLNSMTGSLGLLIKNHKEFKESFEGGRVEQIDNQVQNLNSAIKESSEKN